MFYFGMLAGLYPMTFALQRFHVGRTLGGVVTVWSLICMLTAAVKSWQSRYAQRFFLGFVESIMPTAFMTIISSYYTQKEQSLRQSWRLSSTGLFTIIGGALNYGFGQITTGSLKRWQYIYLLAGALTFIFGMWCFIVPSSPVSAWFLSEEERYRGCRTYEAWADWCPLSKAQVAPTQRSSTWYQGLAYSDNDGLGVSDIHLLSQNLLIGSSYTVNGAVSGFGPLIVSNFG
jgi:MFS family permease